MPLLTAIRAAIVKKDWATAALKADELLIEKDISESTYAQMCYAQAMIAAKISDMDELVDPDRNQFEFVELDPQEFRNAVSFAMEGFNVAVDKKLKDLVFMGASCFLRLTQNMFLSGHLRYLFSIPLSTVANGLLLFPNERVEFLIRIHIMLSQLLVDFLDKKNIIKASEIVAWPTQEEHTQFMTTASDRVVGNLEILAGFLNARPNDYNLPFSIIKIYLKLLQLNPAAKSVKIDCILQKDSLLKTYATIHGASNTEITDTQSLFAFIDEKIKANENSKQVLSFLLDLTEFGLKTNLIPLSKQALEKSNLIDAKSNLGVRRELIQLQLELRETVLKGFKNPKHIESNILRLNHAINKAVDENLEPQVMHSSCIAAWNVIAPSEESATFAKPFSVILKTICEIAEGCPSLFETSQRCSFEYKLAKCYDFQNVFSLATIHAEKALKFCTQPEIANDIEILLHKLWIKANTFDGHLTPDLKALSLTDQAKYIPEDNVAFKLIQKSIKTLILDHDLISPPNTIEKDDLVLSLLKHDYAINFDVIQANDIKNKRTILVALTDNMRQARELAKKQLMLPTEENLKYWKAVWDTSKYILTLEIGNLSDPITAQKLKAEVLLYQGEALFMFETIRPYMLAASKPDSYSENLKTIHAAVIDPMIQSLNIGINLKDSATIQSAASKIWDYFSSTKASISSGNLAFWTEIFQRLYAGLIECSLQNSNLMVCICIGYITVLKEANEQASIAAAVAAAAAQALETVPAKKGSAGKDKKGAKAPPPPKQPVAATKQPAISVNPNAKLIEDVVNLGLSALEGSYETKLALFDLKTSMKTGTPIIVSNIEANPAMRIFSFLEVLESKKGSNEELEDAAQNLFLNGNRLGKNLNFELWLRVIQHSFKADHFHLAYMAAQTLFESLPKTYSPSAVQDSKFDIKPKLLYDGELVFGKIILALIEQGLLFDTPTTMRSLALQKIANCIEIACGLCPAQISDLQSSLTLLCTTAAMGAPHKAYLSHLERVLSALYSCYFTKVSIQSLMNTDVKTQETILQLTEICLEIYKEKADWTASTRIIDRSFKILPKIYHQTLLKRKIQTLSLGNKSGIAALLKEEDVKTKFEMWYMLTTFATERDKQNIAFQESLQAISNDPLYSDKQLEVELIYSKWLLDTVGDIETAKHLIHKVHHTIRAEPTHSMSINKWIIFIQSNTMSAEIEPNQKRKIALLTEAYSIITKLVEPLTSVVPVTPDTGNTKEKPILDAKSRSATPSEKHESPGLKTLENWVGYEWPQLAKDMFANTTNLSIFCKLSITNPRQLLSCLFYMVSQFEEFGQLQQCVPLLAITNLVTTMCIDSKQPQFMQSAVQLYTAIIYSKLFYVELAAKFRKLYQSSENGIDYLAPFWNDSNSGCDIGFSLSTESIILLKANLLIQYGDVLRANNLLIQWIPAFSKNSEALYVSSLLSWISNGDEGIMDLFKVENLKQAILFTKLIHRLVCKSGSQYPQKSTNNVLALITKSMELVQKNPRLELMLWQVKYKLLTAYYEENSSMQIEESFSACVKLTSSMDLCMQGAETLFWHAKFIRQKSSKLQGRDLAKNLLLCFDYLEECQELCETMKMVEKTQSWFLMGYNVALESAALLFQISQEGDLIDYSHRTIEVMIEEHFIPEGETSLSERWIEVQEDAIGKVITNLTRIIASLPQNLQIEGRRILGLCHKIQYQRLMGENLEQASEHLRICQLQFTRALKLAVQNGNINVARDCTEELLSHGTNSDEFSRLAHLSLLQSCHYWSYLSKLFEELNPQPKSELFLGTVNEAHQRQTMALQHNQAYKRVQPFHITPELLSDIPKNVKVLILQHSSDKSCLFGALVYRIKDGKSKSPLEDFSIANIHFPVEIQRINLMIERVKMLLASIGVGAVPDTQIVEDIYQYLQPILKLLEIEPSAKSTEKADSKKKGAKTVSTEPEEIDRGHCVICCDPILELLPLDIVLRVKNLATTTSFEFGLPYLLTRIKFNPGYSSEPVSAEKPAKKGKGGGADAAASSDKFEISTIKAFSACDLPEDFFGSQLPGTLKFEHQTGVMNANEISTGIEGSMAGILIDKGFSLDPVSVARIASPPNIIVSLTEIEGEQGQRLLGQAKLLAGYNYLNGIGITMATSLPSTLTQSQAFARHFIKSKDAIKLRGEMSSEDIVNKRTLFGAYFIRTYGFL